jgi:hypothetical protein
MTLHDAMVDVLARHGGGPMTPRAIAAEIARLGSFIRPSDGQAPPVSQVRRRAGKRPDLFEQVDGAIKLRDPDALDMPPAVETAEQPLGSRRGDGVPVGPFALTENDVVEAVCAELRRGGFVIEQQASTHQHGVDILARHPSGREIRVEAKGGTSSKPGTSRFGQRFSGSQVGTHVAKAFFTASSAPRTESALSAMAFPDTEAHRRMVGRLVKATQQLEIGVFWVGADGEVELDASWELTGG